MWEESLARTRPRRDRQRLVLPQDRRLQLTQHRARADAELLSKRGPQPAKHCQRLGLTATPVQRHHQLPVHLLIQRAARRPLLQLRHQVRVFPRRQPRLHQRPPHLTGQQTQPPGLLLQPHRPAHIHQRPPPPQRQRPAQVPGAPRRAGRPLAPPQQPLRRPRIGAITAQVQRIPRRPGHDRLPAAQHLTQIRNMRLQTVQHRGRGHAAPHHLHQPAGADHLPIMQGQRRQHRLAPQPIHRPRPATGRDIDRPQQSHLHNNPRPAQQKRNPT